MVNALLQGVMGFSFTYADAEGFKNSFGQACGSSSTSGNDYVNGYAESTTFIGRDGIFKKMQMQGWNINPKTARLRFLKNHFTYGNMVLTPGSSFTIDALNTDIVGYGDVAECHLNDPLDQGGGVAFPTFPQVQWETIDGPLTSLIEWNSSYSFGWYTAYMDTDSNHPGDNVRPENLQDMTIIHFDASPQYVNPFPGTGPLVAYQLKKNGSTGNCISYTFSIGHNIDVLNTDFCPAFTGISCFDTVVADYGDGWDNVILSAEEVMTGETHNGWWNFGGNGGGQGGSAGFVNFGGGDSRAEGFPNSTFGYDIITGTLFVDYYQVGIKIAAGTCSVDFRSGDGLHFNSNFKNFLIHIGVGDVGVFSDELNSDFLNDQDSYAKLEKVISAGYGDFNVKWMNMRGKMNDYPPQGGNQAHIIG